MFGPALRNLSASRKAALALLLAGYAVLSLRHAWLADDAYITLRMVDNFLSGHGLRWNVSERALACSHPLWMLLLIPLRAATGEVYYSTIFLSWTLSVLTAWLIVGRCATSFRSAAIALLALCLSKSAMDYSSSGLENPLTHFLCVLFWIVWSGQAGRQSDGGSGRFDRPLALGALFSLAIITRHDAALLLAPAMMFEIASRRNVRHTAWMALGMTPLLVWELFSIAYYGFPFPNTAYAKLNLAVPRLILLTNGWRYLFHTIMFDPLTPMVVGGVTLALAVTRRWRALSFVAGGALYIGYIIWVGGDFMSGRFFSAPMTLAVVGLSTFDMSRLPRTTTLLLVLGVVMSGVLNRNPTLLVGVGSAIASEATAQDQYHGVHDERCYYFLRTGFLAGLGRERWPDGHERAQGERMSRDGIKVQTHYAIGLPGYYAGPGIHIIDVLGLGDPLMARLEFMGIHRADNTLRTQWGDDVLPGHYERPVPVGYVESIVTGVNRIADPNLREYYSHLRLIISGPIWTRARWAAIWKMNTGAYDPLLEAYEKP